MTLWLAIAFVLIGLLLLAGGGEALVRAATTIAAVAGKVTASESRELGDEVEDRDLDAVGSRKLQRRSSRHSVGEPTSRSRT